MKVDVTAMSFLMGVSRKLTVGLATAVMVTCAIVATAGPASASATLTINDGAAITGAGYPYGVLVVGGTATCSTASGTATISVSAIQIVMNQASGGGSTTISCAAQPVQWQVTLGPSNAYCGLIAGNRPDYCFLAGGVATAFAKLTRGGVQEASAIKPVHT